MPEITGTPVSIPTDVTLRVVPGPASNTVLFFEGRDPAARARTMLLLAYRLTSTAAKSLPEESSQRASLEATAETLQGWSATMV